MASLAIVDPTVGRGMPWCPGVRTKSKQAKELWSVGYRTLFCVLSEIGIAYKGRTLTSVSAESLAQNLRVRPLPVKTGSLLGVVIPRLVADRIGWTRSRDC